VQTVEGLRTKLKAVNAKDRESSVEAIIQIATKMGLPFTAEEYERATTSHAGPPKPHRK
jgi:hypothetical protein